MINYYPNILIVSGSGRKVGKTSLISELIKGKSAEFEIAAVKISPHVHDSTSIQQMVFSKGNCKIFIESEFNLKDSSVFLKSGAKPVYYMQTDDINLKEGFNFIISELKNKLVVCESGMLSSLIKPGVSVYIESEFNLAVNKNKTNARSRAGLVISSDRNNLSDVLKNINERIVIKDNKWILSEF